MFSLLSLKTPVTLLFCGLAESFLFFGGTTKPLMVSLGFEILIDT